LFIPDQDTSADLSGEVVRIVEDSRMCAFGVTFVDVSAGGKAYLDGVLGPGMPLRPKPPPLPAK
jgi:hypothetical protein